MAAFVIALNVLGAVLHLSRGGFVMGGLHAAAVAACLVIVIQEKR